MEKEELKTNKINVNYFEADIRITTTSYLQQLNKEINYISEEMKQFYDSQKEIIIKQLEEKNLQNINSTAITQLFKILNQPYKDDVEILECRIKTWNKSNFININGDVLVDDFSIMLQVINENVANIKQQKKDVIYTLENINKPIASYIKQDIEKQYISTIENINKSIKQINKITPKFTEYADKLY